MARYYDGLSEALQKVEYMDMVDALDYMDGLYGRDELPDGYTENEVKEELRRQIRLYYTKPMTEKDKADQEYYKAVTESIRRR